ncbi:FMN-binding negative transcriptional regulator [Mesorhizobium xinjiangense]|uniref:FMN-binding negative transcriptional regulator n=1 Tax=Mesorhizobium xinjiangense TaxID=2678685 RepID=UPI0012ED6057|nr:FMN-binding negative transcriptional regulator [Mesorhizobium xinjiangense]
MYQPPHFKETRLEVMHELIRAHPLGLVVSNGKDGPIANSLPFLLDEAGTGQGVLLAHFSRDNLQWRAIADDPQTPVLVVFQGPQSYVTPSWYETKRQTGKVVPTWNYAIVQARGKAEIVDDPEWLRRQITSLTATHEDGRETPWQLADAPDDFVRAQIKGIVGLRIEIADLEGKWKVSQNRPVADREGVAEGLDSSADTDMARLVRAYGGLADGRQ